jgi:hypothetical protein
MQREDDGRYRLWVDGVERHRDGGYPSWSPDERRMAYWVGNETEKYRLVLDGVVSPFASDTGSLFTWAEDSSEVAYVTSKDGEYYVFVGKKPHRGFEYVQWPIRLGPKGRYAFAGRKGFQDYRLIVDGKEVHADDRDIGAFGFTPRGELWRVDTDRKEKRAYFVCNGTKTELAFDSARCVCLDAEGRLRAYVAHVLVGDEIESVLVDGDDLHGPVPSITQIYDHPSLPLVAATVDRGFASLNNRWMVRGEVSDLFVRPSHESFDPARRVFRFASYVEEGVAWNEIVLDA